MIYVTGDIHGRPVGRLNARNFPEGKDLTKNDTVIILGDFGVIWGDEEESSERDVLDWLEGKPWTTVFVCGNHENFNALYNNYPVKEWNGGKVHEIRPSVLHLMRGEVFNIEGKKFFAFGGASSHDIQDGILDPDDYTEEEFKNLHTQYWVQNKRFRVKGWSWWKEELPSLEEMNNGIKNLEKNNWEVDYVVSHCLPQSAASVFSYGSYEPDILTEYLDELLLKHGLKYSHWYCGHYHSEKEIMGSFTVTYYDVTRIV